jgi:hypothetical protein
MQRTSRGHWGTEEAQELVDAATEATRLWDHNQLDFEELAWDLASEVKLVRGLDDEIGRLETRIDELYTKADPSGIVISAPGVGPILAGGILGRLGDAKRFADLAGVRSFSGMIPKVNQSGHTETRPGITKQGDAGLRRDIWFAADVARHIDPQLAAKYHRLIVERRLHHYSAICHLATTLLTDISLPAGETTNATSSVTSTAVVSLQPKAEPSSGPATGSHPRSATVPASRTRRADQRNKESTVAAPTLTRSHPP